LHETVASAVTNQVDTMKRIHPSGGFTLLELLVAMSLVALVTLIAATAFRLTVQAWERGAEEGESRQIQSALPVLLEKQLGARVNTLMFGKAMVNPDKFFCGTENTLSFLTTYAPQRSLLQGVMWVRYQFDPGQKTLMIYLKSVTRLDDLGESAGGFHSKKTEEGFPVSQIHGIINYRLFYTDDPLFDANDSKQWQREWKCDAETAGAPSGLILEMTIEEGSKARSYRWYYRIGGQQSASPAVGQ
jgi:prepilin-type N-terminal cleavage/methylation domain-containing protein